MTDWAPRAVQESNYRYCAIINAHDAHSYLATRCILNDYGLEVHRFKRRMEFVGFG